MSTSPTTCRLRALTASSVSAGRVPRGVFEIDDVDRRHAGFHERDVVVFDLHAVWPEVRGRAAASARQPR